MSIRAIDKNELREHLNVDVTKEYKGFVVYFTKVDFFVFKHEIDSPLKVTLISYYR